MRGRNYSLCCTLHADATILGGLYKPETEIGLVANFRVARDSPGISHCPMAKDIDAITAAWVNPGFVFYKHS